MTDPHQPPQPDRSTIDPAGPGSTIHQNPAPRAAGPDRARTAVQTGPGYRTGPVDRQTGPGQTALPDRSVGPGRAANHATGPDRSTGPDRQPAGRSFAVRTFLMAGGAIFALSFLFSFGNVWALADLLGVKGWIAPLIGPAVDMSVVGVMIAVQWLSLAGVTHMQLRPAMRLLYVCGMATLLLNSAPSAITGYMQDDPKLWGRALVEAVAPFLLIAWAHVGPIIIRLFVEVSEQYAARRTAAEKARADRSAAIERERGAEADRARADQAAAVADREQADRAQAEAIAIAEIEASNAAAVRADQIRIDQAQADRATAEARALEARAAADRAAADRAVAEAYRSGVPIRRTGTPLVPSGPVRQSAGPPDRTDGPDRPGPADRATGPDDNVAPIKSGVDSRREALAMIRDAFPDHGTWTGLLAALKDPRNTTVTQNGIRAATGMGKGRIMLVLEHANDQLLPYSTATPSAASPAQTDSADQETEPERVSA